MSYLFNDLSEKSNFKKDFWDELPTEVKQMVIDAKLELDNDQCIPHEIVMKEIKDQFFLI